MKISPEPLHPLRAWRELWHAEPLHYDRVVHQTALPAHLGKNNKRPGFHWLTTLLNRESSH